jgi:DNA-binding IclR family transcriptional regulator
METKTFTSLKKALDILSLYSLDCTSISAKQISKILDLPLSTTYKYIDVLLRRAFLARKAGSKKFYLGLSIFRLGNVFVAGFDLIDVAIPHMRVLSEVSGETILLTAVENHLAICLEKMEPRRLIKLSLERGRALPLHAGASSRVLLAYQDEAFIDAYVKKQKLQSLTKNTITTLSKLRTELKRTRENGYATSESEVDEGATAVAAPIFDHTGQLMAGLSIAGPTERLNNKSLNKIIAMVKTKALEISKDIGYNHKTKLLKA